MLILGDVLIATD